MDSKTAVSSREVGSARGVRATGKDVFEKFRNICALKTNFALSMASRRRLSETTHCARDSKRRPADRGRSGVGIDPRPRIGRPFGGAAERISGQHRSSDVTSSAAQSPRLLGQRHDAGQRGADGEFRFDCPLRGGDLLERDSAKFFEKSSLRRTTDSRDATDQSALADSSSSSSRRRRRRKR